jgi:hypothetical protein
MYLQCPIGLSGLDVFLSKAQANLTYVARSQVTSRLVVIRDKAQKARQSSVMCGVNYTPRCPSAFNSLTSLYLLPTCACRIVFTRDKSLGEVVYWARRNLFPPVSFWHAPSVYTLLPTLILISLYFSVAFGLPLTLTAHSTPLLTATCSIRSSNLYHLR